MMLVLVGGNHIKMTVMQEDSAMFDCIAFNHGEYFAPTAKRCSFDMCYTLRKIFGKSGERSS